MPSIIVAQSSPLEAPGSALGRESGYPRLLLKKKTTKLGSRGFDDAASNRQLLLGDWMSLRMSYHEGRHTRLVEAISPQEHRAAMLSLRLPEHLQALQDLAPGGRLNLFGSNLKIKDANT